MRHLATLCTGVLLFTIFLAAGCSGGPGTSQGATEGTGSSENTGSSSETTGGSPEDTANPVPETTQEAGATDGAGTTQETSQGTPGASGGLQIEQVASGPGGLSQRQVVIGPSAGALSQATGARVPDAGEGTYLAAFWGEKPTGGYTVEILSARKEGNRVVVRLALRNPPADAMVSQALTYPYAAAVIRTNLPEDTEFTFVTQGGRELGWPVRRF